jgi:serine/threonine protein kinase
MELVLIVVHSLNLVHTDLKPENILLVENGYYTLGARVSIPAYMDLRRVV